MIDIDKLTESEIIDLNHRIVERLRFLQHARAHVGMLRLRIGQRVVFEPDGRGPVSAVVTRYNQKTVSVVTSDGQRWRVAPSLLRPEDGTEVSTEAVPKVVQLPHTGRRK